MATARRQKSCSQPLRIRSESSEFRTFPPMYIVFDTETTGLPKDWKAPVSQVDNWPRLVQLGWMRFDAANEVVEEANLIIYPDGFVIPKEASRIHGISQARALVDGLPVADVLTRFVQALEA